MALWLHALSNLKRGTPPLQTDLHPHPPPLFITVFFGGAEGGPGSLPGTRRLSPGKADGNKRLAWPGKRRANSLLGIHRLPLADLP